MMALLLIMVKSLTESVNYNFCKINNVYKSASKGKRTWVRWFMGHIIKNCDFHHHRFTSFKSIHALKKSELHFDAFPISKHLNALTFRTLLLLLFYVHILGTRQYLRFATMTTPQGTCWYFFNVAFSFFVLTVITELPCRTVNSN